MIETIQIPKEEIEIAAELLRRGELVAFPTETVYGLGARLFCEEAIRKIFHVKGRPSDNPLIVHISDLAVVETIAKEIPPLFYRLAETFFPGPLTLVLPKADKVPNIVSGGLPTIALRMPNHVGALQLIELVNEPLVAPSANLSGKPSATRVSHVLDDFNGKIAGVVLGEEASIGIESTVVSLLSGKVEILRPGYVTKEALEECLRQEVSIYKKQTHSVDPVPSPGMRYVHYAPEAKVFLYTTKEEILKHLKQRAVQSYMVLANDVIEGVEVFPLTPSSFYANLRLSDQLGCEEVLLLCDSSVQKNGGFMNRIERASGVY